MGDEYFLKFRVEKESRRLLSVVVNITFNFPLHRAGVRLFDQAAAEVSEEPVQTSVKLKSSAALLDDSFWLTIQLVVDSGLSFKFLQVLLVQCRFCFELPEHILLSGILLP